MTARSTPEAVLAVVAPFRTSTFDALPRPASLLTTSVPPRTVTLPVKVFVPFRTKRPEPACVRVAVPPTAPPIVKVPPSPFGPTVAPPSVSRRLPVIVTAPVPRFRLRVPAKVKSPAQVCTGFDAMVTTCAEVLSKVVAKPTRDVPAPSESVPVPSAPLLLTLRPLLAAIEMPPAKVLAPESVKTAPLPESASEPRPAKLPAKFAGIPAAPLTVRATAAGVTSAVLSVMVPPVVPSLANVSEVTPAPKLTPPPATASGPAPRAAEFPITKLPLLTVVPPV